MIETIISLGVFSVVVLAATAMVTVSNNMLTSSRGQYLKTEEYIMQIETKDPAAWGAPAASDITYTLYASGSPAPILPDSYRTASVNVYTGLPIAFFAPAD
jgi:Tfp pilus assembly protein PilV